MRVGFLSLPPEERLLHFGQAAIRRNVSPVVLEKDFWVCWLLGVLFSPERDTNTSLNATLSGADAGAGQE